VSFDRKVKHVALRGSCRCLRPSFSAWPWGCRYYEPSKGHQLFTSLHGVQN